MSTDTNKRIASRFFEHVDDGDVDACQTLLTEDFVAHLAGNERPMNAQEFLGLGRALTNAFANSRHVIESQVAEGDCVETRLTWTGVHVAEFNAITASHKPVKVAAVSFDRFVDGKIAEHRALIDMMSLMTQIGAVPAFR